ncbi:hypothetical protein LJR039_007400 [Pseudorhodoferax sp. LjRoot39]|uniref:hypothetical protein n=1 Tax=Pseudorhodoferax sp. LjRoot39 TaxID=3342328 RepID=UPI003ECCF715
MRIENTNTARIEARYVPAGAVEQRDNQARTVVYLFKLLSRAAEAAIRSKKECITHELLQSVIGARTFA